MCNFSSQTLLGNTIYYHICYVNQYGQLNHFESSYTPLFNLYSNTVWEIKHRIFMFSCLPAWYLQELKSAVCSQLFPWEHACLEITHDFWHTRRPFFSFKHPVLDWAFIFKDGIWSVLVIGTTVDSVREIII